MCDDEMIGQPLTLYMVQKQLLWSQVYTLQCSELRSRINFLKAQMNAALFEAMTCLIETGSLCLLYTPEKD